MRKRLIFRVDDVGYTPVYDIGVFKVLSSGRGCSADVMLDSPDTAEALKKLKDMPWLSVGWHRHLWESPVLPPEEVPSLVDERGRFRWGHRKQKLMDEASYDDAYREFDAEVQLCLKVLGRVPDVARATVIKNDLERAYTDILNKYGIPHGCFSTESTHRNPSEATEQYAHLNIISLNVQPDHGFGLEYFSEYDPLRKMMKPVWTEKEEIYFYGWHPGYCDEHIMAESTCSLHRCKEFEAVMSDEYRDWIIREKIELINFRDALYGTNEFQNHLKETGSSLWIGNM